MKKTISPGSKVKRLVALLIYSTVMLLIPQLTRAQSVCMTAGTLTDTAWTSGQSNADSVMWYSFVAHKTSGEIQLKNDSLPPAVYTHMQLYSGACAGLTLIDTSAIESYGCALDYSGLSVSSVYYLKLSKSGTSLANYSIGFVSLTPGMTCSNCFSMGCELKCNYGFEHFSSVPTGFSQITNSYCYSDPNGSLVGSSDFFNTAGSTATTGIPVNDFGSENAHTGNSYGGIFVYRDFISDPNYPELREYIVGKIASPLVAGQYTISFWVSLADKSGYAVGKLGAYISSGIPTQFGFGPMTSLTPQIMQPNIISQDNGWVQITGTYTAAGGEQYITIGQFTYDGQEPRSAHTPSATSLNNHYSYYYIDDISVLPNHSRSITQSPAQVCSGKPVILTLHPRYTGQTSVWTATQGTVTCTSASCDSVVFSNPFNTPTTFTVITTINGSCTDTVTYTFSPNGVPPTVSAGSDQSICPKHALTLSGTENAAGPVRGWSTVSGQVLCTQCNTMNVSPLVTTSYVFSATDTTSGCTNRDTMTVTVNPLPSIQIVSPANIAITTCADSLLFIESASGYFASFQWSTNAPGYSGQNTAALHTHWNGQISNGYVVVTGTTAEGCKAKDSLVIPSCCLYYTPENVLLPNIVNDSASHLSVSHPGLFSTISSTCTATDKQFSINGLFIVNINTSLVGCDVKLGPNAKIIIRPGKTLLLNKSSNGPTRLHACSDLWDGIYVDGTNSLSTLKVTGGTSIEDAKNAIVSTNGGYFVLDGTSGGQIKLNKNNIGVLIKSYSGTHPGLIRNTIIACDAPGQPGATPVTYAGANCRGPVNGKAYAAVYVDSCSNVIIGDSTLSTYRNLMERQKFGVYAKNSNVNVWNNDFKYYTLAPGPYKNNPLEGVAVYATGSSSISRTLTVGRVGNYKAHNLMRKCSYGVMAENYMNLNCEYNRIDSISAMGVLALNDLNRSILINKDSITEFTGTGINCTNIKQSVVTITNNLLNETTTNTPASFAYTGIYAANALNYTSSNVTIRANTIKRIRNGVWVMNVTGAKVADNTITFYPNQVVSTAFPGIGIKLEAAHSALVRNNSVNNNITGNPASTSYDRVLGISVTSSMNDTITQNVLTKCGSGLFMKGTNWPVLIGCNKFQTCYYGTNFGLSNAVQTSVYIPSQLRWGNPASGTATPTGNTWTGTISGSDMKGKIYPAITWWCNVSNMPTTGGLIFGSLSNFSNTATTIGTSDKCSVLLNPVETGSPKDLRDALLSDICKAARTYDTLSADYRYADSVYAYRILKDNPSWLSLGASDDSVYSAWYTASSATNVGQLAAAEDDLKAQNFTAASAILNSLTPHGTPEGNRIVVLNVYLNTWAKDSMNLDSLQTLTLLDIASQPPVTGGTAVYDARAMLFLEIHDSSALRLAPAPVTESTGTSPGHIYPNPTTGKLMLNYELPEGQSASLKLYDIAGHLVHTYPCVSGTSVQQFDASEVPAGMYFYTVLVNGSGVLSEKVIIIKQE